jgi:trehalose 6-phosphate phosphatase
MLVPGTLPSPPGLSALSETRPVSLFLDFDGTLVELAEIPSAISVPDRLGARLEALSTRLGGRLALISGRAVPDLERYLGSLRVARAGSHGLARMLADGAPLGAEPEALPEGAGPLLESFAAEHGFLLEQKPHGAALHYRTASHLEHLGLEFAGNLADLYGLQVKRGSYVIELVCRGADKGAAVQAFMGVEPFVGSRPVFIGDDLTDEDGFAAASGLGGFGVLVGDREPTAASYRLADAAAVHAWLGL